MKIYRFKYFVVDIPLSISLRVSFLSSWVCVKILSILKKEKRKIVVVEKTQKDIYGIVITSTYLDLCNICKADKYPPNNKKVSRYLNDLYYLF